MNLLKEKYEKLIIKTDEKTDSRYGNFPEERNIEEHIKYGIINLDKPRGYSCSQVVNLVKKILNIKKVGYSGTLDEKVTGVLPILLEKARKISQAFLFAKKEYVGILRLHKEDVPNEKIKKTFKKFIGKIQQKPPLKSAVRKELRVKEIYYLDFLEKEGREVLFKVGCESGTYIRKLCSDIGISLGTKANMQKLRRTKVGNLIEEEIKNLYDLKDAYDFYLEDGDESFLRKVILPVEKGVEHLNKIWVNDNTIDSLCHGSPLYSPGICKLNSGIKNGEMIAIFSLKNELIALGKSLFSSEEILNSNSGIIANVEEVIMERGTYPRKIEKNYIK